MMFPSPSTTSISIVSALRAALLLGASLLLLPRDAWANWGEPWGAMMWRSEALAVAALGLGGLGALAAGLGALATRRILRRASSTSAALALLLIPSPGIA